MKVGELSAHIRLDGKPEFDRGVDDAGRRFQGLGKTAQGVAQGLATGLVAATGTMAGLGAAAFKTGIEYNALQQSSRAALTTLLGSAEAANAQMDKLDDFARTSPFAKDVFIQAQQQMIGFGIAAEDVIPILGAVQDATAAVGGSNRDISEIVTTLSKISSTGKITAQDLNELGNKGIDAAGLIGAEFGKTGGEIREMITKGQISADDAIDAITNQMSVKFGGAAANVKETWVGAVDRIKAAWRDTGSVLAAPFVDPNGGGKAIAWANDFADVLRAVQRQAEPLMGIVMARWGSDLDKITPYLQGLKDRIDGLDMSALNESLGALEGYGPIIAGLSAAFAAWGTATIPVIGGINPIVAGVTALVLATPELRDGIGGVLSAASPLLPIMSGLGREVADLGMKVLKEVAPAFIELATSVVEAAVPLAGPFAGAVSGILQIAEPLIGVLADVVGWIAELPDEVLLAGTAFLMLKDNMGPLTGVVNAVKGAFDTLQLRRHLASMDGLTGAAALGRGAMMNFSGAVKAVGGALKTAFISNAPALAIAGLVTVIGKIAGASADAKAYVEALAESFDEVTGAATDASRALVAEELQGTHLSNVWGIIGEDASDLTEALLGNEEAAARVNAVFAEMRDTGVQGSDGIKYVGFHADELEDKFAELSGRTEEARDKHAEYQRLVGDTSSTGKAISAEEEMIATRERLIEVLDLEVGALQTLIDKRREERGEALSLAEAQIRDAEAREKMVALIEMEGSALDETGNRFDAYSEKGKAAIEATRGVSDSMNTTADSMAAAGENAEAITAALNEQYDSWIETAVAMGVPEEKAHELATAYGLIPSDIATEAVLETEGIQQTLAELQIEIDETNGTIKINGDPVPGQTTLAELEHAIDNGNGTVTINGNDLPAWLTVDALVASIVANDDAILALNADSRPGQKKLKSLAGEVRATEESVIINANNVPAQNMRLRTQADINNTWGYVRIGAETGAFYSWLSRVNGRTVGTAYVQVGAVGSGVAMMQADGAVVDYYADGGVRENHVAQIAPAGAWRVWAEPETGGEAYIPLAPSKRARSVQILEETADRFDLMVVPKGATAFAGGGVSGGPSGGGRSVAPASVGRTVILQVGDREFTGYMEELADGRIASNPGVAAANGLVNNMSRYRAQIGV